MLRPDTEAALLSAVTALDAILKALDQPHRTAREVMASAGTIVRALAAFCKALRRIPIDDVFEGLWEQTAL
jgi:hypothetical protein